MVQVIDIIRTTCGVSCQSMANCWHSGFSKGPSTDPLPVNQQIQNLFGSPRVIKSNNPEVKTTLGDEYCLLVCDQEIDNMDPVDAQWEISWYKMRPNGVWDRALVDKDRYHVSEEKLVLRIENVMYEDRGIYRCEVINTEGKFSPSQAEFNVIVIPEDSEDGRVQLRIDQTPICCKVGEKVNMIAVIENRPKKMKVDWYKMQGIEETPINRRRLKIVQNKLYTQAKVKCAGPQDAGVYRIKVTAPGDYAVGHVILNVNTVNCEVEVEEMMKRAFAAVDLEASGMLTPTQIRDTMMHLGLTVPHGTVDDVIYLAVDGTGKMVHYQTFMDKVIYQYKSELA